MSPCGQKGRQVFFRRPGKKGGQADTRRPGRSLSAEGQDAGQAAKEGRGMMGKEDQRRRVNPFRVAPDVDLALRQETDDPPAESR